MYCESWLPWGLRICCPIIWLAPAMCCILAAMAAMLSSYGESSTVVVADDVLVIR